MKSDKDCGCGKSTPGPLGGKPKPSSMVASASQTRSIIYVAPDGERIPFGDLLGARAEGVRRGGGSIEFG